MAEEEFAIYHGNGTVLIRAGSVYIELGIEAAQRLGAALAPAPARKKQRKHFWTDAERVDVERRYRAGDPLTEIGDVYGVTQAAVSNLLRGLGVSGLRKPGVAAAMSARKRKAA